MGAAKHLKLPKDKADYVRATVELGSMREPSFMLELVPLMEKVTSLHLPWM